MLKNCILIIQFISCVFYSYGQHNTDSLIDLQLRNAWILKGKEYLLTIDPLIHNDTVEVNTVILDGSAHISVRVKSEGYLSLKGQSWIYFLTVSSHDFPRIGDVSLAIDHKKRIYINNGHICGGIIHFSSDKIKGLSVPRQFFRYFRSDTDNIGWDRLN